MHFGRGVSAIWTLNLVWKILAILPLRRSRMYLIEHSTFLPWHIPFVLVLFSFRLPHIYSEGFHMYGHMCFTAITLLEQALHLSSLVVSLAQSDVAVHQNM